MTVIREYVPETDAASLAAHFLRSGYGPHHGLTQLGPQSMSAVLTERAPELFMVASDGEEIIGCIGFMRGSGRRVTREGEVFAGLFVLDPRHRNSMLAGNLFVKSFEKLVAKGTRAMRIEANPTNKKAFPLYLRVGFRALPDARADEDGYVELVSHLPGVIGDLLRSNVGEELSGVLPRFNWRNAGGGRDMTPTSGVGVQADGAVVVSYDLTAGDFKLRANIDMESGRTLSYDTISGSIGDLPLHPGLDQLGGPEVLASRTLGHGIIAEVDSFGSVRIYGPELPGPALVDHWPVVRGDISTGWRRPHRIPVHLETAEDSWLMTSAGESGTVSKLIRFTDGQMSVSSNLLSEDGDRELVASPWVSMRMAEKYILTMSEAWVGGPAVRGIWPADYTDFEACVDEIPSNSEAVRSVWRNSSMVIDTSWPAGTTVRHEGNHLPQFRRPANIPLTYDISVSPAQGWERPHRFLAPAGLNVEKVRRVQRPDCSVPRECLPPSWHPSERQGRDVLECGEQMSLRYSESARGIIGWSHQGNEILSSPYPSVRSWGSLTDWTAGLWAATCTPRDSPEQGVEWVGRASALPLGPIGDQTVQDFWTVTLNEGATPAIEISADFAFRNTPTDMAFYVTPATNPGASILFGGQGTEKWVVEATNRPWSLSTTRIAIELQNGGYLVARTVAGVNQEIFVRSEPKGIHLSLLSRIENETGKCSWKLSILPHRSAALAEMDR
ncbi:GNAT family N-acetyltransferase [Arthrobacter sp. efr-133-R2A-120]|uniref:GNAT family N-acetyltransferase n=1 Tax=Arthrobacter sp. efr-133-R2A-120 TaxID=3040277 RepID=UPI002549E2B3|nr:GNAT family N-acetyltransferase [Arthrobacter sp. efr-133-R2A-120]